MKNFVVGVILITLTLLLVKFVADCMFINDELVQSRQEVQRLQSENSKLAAAVFLEQQTTRKLQSRLDARTNQQAL